MNKKTRREVVECLMCASDNASPPLFELGFDDFEKPVVEWAILLKDTHTDDACDHDMAYTLTALEAAYRLIEQDEDLLREWFARPDMGALIAELAHAPPPDGYKERVLEECDKVDAENFDLQVASSLDTIDQSEPTPAPEAQLHDVHSDDETTHVGAEPVDDRFDNGGDL